MNTEIQQGSFPLSRLTSEKLSYLVMLATSQSTARMRRELAETLSSPLLPYADAEKMAKSFEQDLINYYDLDMDGLDCLSESVRMKLFKDEVLVVSSPLFVFSPKDSTDVFGPDSITPTPTYCPPANWFSFFEKDQYSSISIAEPVPMKRWAACVG
jgi:hypothetical protein